VERQRVSRSPRSGDDGGNRRYPPSVGASNQQVTALIARRVRPLLRGYGFTDFTGRRAWFVEDEVISHVTFNAVGSYFAGAVGCTSYSFSVEAGVYYRVLGRDLLRPQDYNLTFRLLFGKVGYPFECHFVGGGPGAPPRPVARHADCSNMWGRWQ
jgi:hypothetical protein